MRPHALTGPLAALVLIAGNSRTAIAADDPSLNSAQQRQSPTAFAGPKPKQVSDWGSDEGRSVWIPALDILGFELALNRVDRLISNPQVYRSPIDNLHANLHRDWVVDNDQFSVNQFLHPYQGSVYQGFARSAGLTFWQAFPYTLGGSLLWEYAGENTAPSINDEIATGIGGNFLGEPLFRIASLILESAPDGHPGFLRTAGAALINPAMVFNRVVYGDRFDAVWPSNDPAVFTRIDLGASISTHFSSNVNVNRDPTAEPIGQSIHRSEPNATFTVSYGLPGKDDYAYTRPFDYFNFELAADTTNSLESIFSRGLLVGTDYAVGDRYRGIWGLYGVYDYAAPKIFRVSTTAAALGTTAQWWLSSSVALQGTVLAGVGYAAGGVIHGAGVRPAGPLGEGQRDYHYGVAPNGLVTLRVIFGDRLAIDSTARAYYISRLGATESSGTEHLIRADLTATLRVWNLHGITLRYDESTRDGKYGNFPNSHQRIGTVTLGYTLLGQTRFGAVDWREPL